MIKLSVVAVVGWVLCFSNAQAQQQNKDSFTIHWTINPSPPFHILKGEYKNLGICDILIDKISKTLPNINHEVRVMPQTRIKYNAMQNQNLCFPCMIKREHSPYFYYSDVTVTHPPLGIILRATLAQRLAEENATYLSFTELASNNKLRFGRPVARRFPPELQEVIDEYQQTPRFFEIAGEDATTRVMKQVSRGRLDYALEYPTILRYYSLSHPVNDLTFLPTEELGYKNVPGAVGCTKNEWGTKAITEINHALKMVLQDEEYQAQQAFWQDISY
ncbi:hypothetical protein CA267_003180 [Alteromonas pelagimontana]|uniref:ABC transporter substrate-binding protein n=1 Tax=Alteromonas pelagimontana TaxID=1858656 RepID=A0A6M4MCI0_9ALTE|nr:hypothetical protein [Alteromonas pelagimontana]QJR79856.1 hypothetical protein CA267_003180 [Alteromonas pelagimontana]